MIKIDNIYYFSKYISWQVMPQTDFVYILHNKDNNFYYFDGVSKEIWDLINKKYDFEDIVDHLYKKYKINKNELENDVKDFIEDLKIKGIVL